MLRLQRVLTKLAKVNELINDRGGSQTQVGLWWMVKMQTLSHYIFHCPLHLQNVSNGIKTSSKVMVQNCNMKLSFVMAWECSGTRFYKEKKQHLRCDVR